MSGARTNQRIGGTTHYALTSGVKMAPGGLSAGNVKARTTWHQGLIITTRTYDTRRGPVAVDAVCFATEATVRKWVDIATEATRRPMVILHFANDTWGYRPV